MGDSDSDWRHETQRLAALSKRGLWIEALQILPDLLLGC